MVFEVEDLSQASPATVSRCGMVYIDPDDLSWEPYVKTWAIHQIEDGVMTEEQVEFITNMMFDRFNKGLRWVKKKCGVGINQVIILLS